MRRGWLIALISVAVASWAAIVLPGTAASAASTVGAAEITQPGVVTPLSSGGSATQYGVALPAGAHCSGDTQHQQFHIFTYLFPESLSPTAVSFKTGEPAGLGADGRFGFISGGQYVGALNTAPGSGQVVGLPAAYTWTRLTPTDLFAKGESSSTWNAGIACANRQGVVTNYWNTTVVFTASSADPGGFTWVVPKTAQTAVSDPHGFPIGVVLVIVAVILALGALVLSLRRRSEGRHVNR